MLSCVEKDPLEHQNHGSFSQATNNHRKFTLTRTRHKFLKVSGAGSVQHKQQAWSTAQSYQQLISVRAAYVDMRLYVLLALCAPGLYTHSLLLIWEKPITVLSHLLEMLIKHSAQHAWCLTVLRRVQLDWCEDIYNDIDPNFSRVVMC